MYELMKAAVVLVALLGVLGCSGPSRSGVPVRRYEKILGTTLPADLALDVREEQAGLDYACFLRLRGNGQQVQQFVSRLVFTDPVEHTNAWSKVRWRSLHRATSAKWTPERVSDGQFGIHCEARSTFWVLWGTEDGEGVAYVMAFTQ